MEHEEKLLDINGGGISTEFYYSEGSERTVVFCHGLGSDKSGYRKRAEKAVEEGFNAVIFDFRGNGKSSGLFEKTNLTSRIKDLGRVLAEVKNQRIGVYGSSFGGLVAIHRSVKDKKIDALSLRSPVTFYRAMGDLEVAVNEEGFYEPVEGKRVTREFLMDVKRYSAEEAMEELSIPTLVMHGSEDGVINLEDSKRFYSGLECEKRLQILEGEGHRLSKEADRQAVANALEWFDKQI